MIAASTGRLLSAMSLMEAGSLMVTMSVGRLKSTMNANVLCRNNLSTGTAGGPFDGCTTKVDWAGFTINSNFTM